MAGLERGWKVADTESILATMPAIMETSGISVNSMMDGALFGVHLDDAEEARENDEELEALEEMVAQRRRSSQRMAQCEAVDTASSSPPAMYHRQSLSGGGGGVVQQDPSSSLLMMMVNSSSPSGGADGGEPDQVEQPTGDANESYEATD